MNCAVGESSGEGKLKHHKEIVSDEGYSTVEHTDIRAVFTAL